VPSCDGESLARRFPYTSVALGFTLLVTVAAVLWNINVFSIPALSFIGIAETEAGEIGIAALLILPAFFVDRILTRQRMHDSLLRSEQLRVLHVTMRTVQDIVNNNLNQLQLLRLEAEGHVSEATLALFDDSLADTAAQLTTLGNMNTFTEMPLASGSGLRIAVSNPACSDVATGRKEAGYG
jgi:hypothetical protein